MLRDAELSFSTRGIDNRAGKTILSIPVDNNFHLNP